MKKDGIYVYDLDDMACFFLFLLLLFGILESSLVFFSCSYVYIILDWESGVFQYS